MAQLPVDPDSGAQSQTGVGQVDQTNRSLHQVNPNWLEDGHGVRGPQRQIVKPTNARPSGIQFTIDNQANKALSDQPSITVTAEDASGYAPGEGVESVDGVTTLTFDQDVFEIYDGGGGQCVVKLKTCDATCP